MKKRIILLSTALSFLGLVASIIHPATFKADASAKASVLLKDNFNNKDYKQSYDDSKWDVAGDHIRQSTSSDSYIENSGSKKSGGEYVAFATRDIIYDLEYFQIDMMLPAATSGRNQWVGFKFLKESISTDRFNRLTYDFSFGIKADSGIWSNNDNASHDEKGEADLKSDCHVTGSAGLNEQFGMSTINSQWITMKVVPVSETEAKLYLALQGDEPSDETKVLTLTHNTTGAMNFKNCRIAIQTETITDKVMKGIKFDNLKIVGKTKNVSDELEPLELEDDFSTYDEDTSMFINYVNGDGESAYGLGGNSTMDINPGAALGDRLISKVAVNEETSAATTVNVIDAKFNVSISSSAVASEKFAFVFGLEDINSPIGVNGSYVEFNKSSVVVRVFKDGAQVGEQGKAITGLTSYDGVNFQILVVKDGTIIVKNEETEVIRIGDNPEYKGKFGFVALGDFTHKASLDDIVVKTNSYYVPVTKSVTHNFSNNFFGNAGYEDFYLNFTGKGYLKAVDGKLRYEGCSDGTFFGSAHQYDSFILDFKICSIYVGTGSMTNEERTSEGKWLGLDLSRKAKATPSYGNYATLMFDITPPEGRATEGLPLWVNPMAMYPCDTDNVKITYAKGFSCDMFRKLQYSDPANKGDIKETDYVCVRFISYGDAIELYLKTNGEAEFTRYYRYEGLELNGYFALCNTGYTYMELDDFSMTNTSPIYVCADNEAPETIVETETQIIYDPGNVDVNMDEELQLNTGSNTLWIVLTAVFGATTLGLGALFVFQLIKRKGKKPAKAGEGE